MVIYWKLVTVILVLTLDSRVHSEHIHGGHEAAPHSRPYMALLKRHMQDGKTGYCGGFLLNEDFVMTAAHCQAKSYIVLLGLHKFYNTDGIQQIPVEKSFPRKDYNATDYSNDIMLLKLSSKAHFNKKVKPISLAEQDNGSLPNSCTISGWGRTDRNGTTMSPVLMETSVTLIKHCQKENSYCSKGKTGPVQGDSGGPLVCEDGTAFGVVSSGSLQIYSYSKIPDYRDWIGSIMM